MDKRKLPNKDGEILAFALDEELRAKIFEACVAITSLCAYVERSDKDRQDMSAKITAVQQSGLEMFEMVKGQLECNSNTHKRPRPMEDADSEDKSD